MAPARHREWIAAMMAEADALTCLPRLHWYAAAFFVAATLRLRACPRPLQAAGLASVMIVEDWTWGAMVPALVLMGLSAAVLSRPAGDGRAAACIVAGGTLPLAHVVANWVPSLRPSYQVAFLDAQDWLILSAVAAIGVCAVRIVEALHSRRCA